MLAEQARRPEFLSARAPSGRHVTYVILTIMNVLYSLAKHFVSYGLTLLRSRLRAAVRIVAASLRTKRRLSIAVGLSTVGLIVLAIFARTGNRGFDPEPPPLGKHVELVEASELPLDETVDVRTKKETFFDFMRPIVKAENERIRALRERLLAARASGDAPAWIPEVADQYDVDWTGQEWDALLKAVDIVPIPLALAQSANESNWGTSRFAQEGNNMFGQWCFSEGCGMVPNRRSAGRTHEVRSFDTVNHAVRSYVRNINTSAAYQELRELRWQARQEGREPEASELVAGLGRYSERGPAYISEIRSMIRVNRELMSSDPQSSEG